MPLSSILHQVCSSDYVTESWISRLTIGYTISYNNIVHFVEGNWHCFKATHFQLLLTLCQLANKTITNAINRFYMQSVITSNVLTEPDFPAQLHTSNVRHFDSLNPRLYKEEVFFLHVPMWEELT
jgi:hypothetical protein